MIYLTLKLDYLATHGFALTALNIEFHLNTECFEVPSDECGSIEALLANGGLRLLKL